MPSLTVIVPNSRATPPASRTPSLAAAVRRRIEALQGVISFHEEAIPICGLTQSSSVSPTARSIARAAAFWMPSVTSRERGLMSTGVSLESVVMTVTVARAIELQPGATAAAPTPLAMAISHAVQRYRELRRVDALPSGLVARRHGFTKEEFFDI